jgi:hypothetical protein
VYVEGTEEDRTRSQFTARITHHPPGEPGHAYIAQDLAYLRANTLKELEQLITEFEAGFRLGVNEVMQQVLRSGE